MDGRWKNLYDINDINIASDEGNNIFLSNDEIQYDTQPSGRGEQDMH